MDTNPTLAMRTGSTSLDDGGRLSDHRPAPPGLLGSLALLLFVTSIFAWTHPDAVVAWLLQRRFVSGDVATLAVYDMVPVLARIGMLAGGLFGLHAAWRLAAWSLYVAWWLFAWTVSIRPSARPAISSMDATLARVLTRVERVISTITLSLRAARDHVFRALRVGARVVIFALSLPILALR